MQVLTAYAFDRAAPAAAVAERLARVERHYDNLWLTPVIRRGSDAGPVGLHIWDAEESPWAWPAWDADAEMSVATVYQPLGYERILGAAEPGKSAASLGRELIARPERVLELTPPLVVGCLEPAHERLTLITDALGIGRLFELRFPGGRVWSNRPAAACLFAGVRAEASVEGWHTAAVSGWFMGEKTPFRGVSAVPAATRIVCDPRDREPRRTSVDVLGRLTRVEGSPLSEARLDSLADALQGVARSVASIWPGEIVVSLSGGRDSRMVAAAFLSAGVAVRLRTGGAEGDVAAQLVAALPYEVEHGIDADPIGDSASKAERYGKRTGAIGRAVGWHRYAEGLRTATFLPTHPPRGLQYLGQLTLKGTAGEISHGYYYPDNLEELNRLGPDARRQALVEGLVVRFMGGAGRTEEAKATTEDSVRHVLDAAIEDGFGDAVMLDYFYAAERLRRWSMAGERQGLISPLLVPEFVEAAFGLTPEQRSASALPRALTAHLIPEWAGIPYYRQPEGVPAPPMAPRLHEDPDRDLITTILETPESWEGCFDPEVMRRFWGLMLNGDGTPSRERLIQRLVVMATFEDYLKELNGEPVPERPPTSPPGRLRRAARRLARRSS